MYVWNLFWNGIVYCNEVKYVTVPDSFIDISLIHLNQYLFFNYFCNITYYQFCVYFVHLHILYSFLCFVYQHHRHHNRHNHRRIKKCQIILYIMLSLDANFQWKILIFTFVTFCEHFFYMGCFNIIGFILKMKYNNRDTLYIYLELILFPS